MIAATDFRTVEPLMNIPNRIESIAVTMKAASRYSRHHDCVLWGDE